MNTVVMMIFANKRCGSCKPVCGRKCGGDRYGKVTERRQWRVAVNASRAMEKQ